MCTIEFLIRGVLRVVRERQKWDGAGKGSGELEGSGGQDVYSEHVEFHFCKMKHSGGSTGDSHKNNV